MEELTEDQIEELRQGLAALRRDLQAILATAREGARPVDLDLPIGRLSRIDALQQQQMARASLAALELRLRQVSVAVAVCEAGDYGYCRKCDEPIGYQRLKARPETPFCLACQAGAEARR
ncbi:MAG: TraR/DksA family transcriptional regulator [Deferrisomatales bacterium]|nr:TraR/DksA family transcriptional regulator [Deferrisomatales bacterium]